MQACLFGTDVRLTHMGFVPMWDRTARHQRYWLSSGRSRFVCVRAWVYYQRADAQFFLTGYAAC